jgi:hypothetical protein
MPGASVGVRREGFFEAREMINNDFAWSTMARCAYATAGSMLAVASHAADAPRWDTAPVMFAQAAASPSIEKIRAQSQRMKEYRALLADPDSNVRLAALDEMLKSGEAAMRELAFDAGFASADQNMRALALRARILSMKTLSLELQNTQKLDEEAWQKLSAPFRGFLTFHITKADSTSGNIDLYGGGSGRVAGQELSLNFSGGSVRLRLTDGAVLAGTFSSRGSTSVGASLTLQ